MFQCRFCLYSCSSLKEFLKHRNFHRNINRNYPCGFRGCKTVLNTEASLRSHIIRCHNIRVSFNQDRNTLFVANKNAKYMCTIPYCKKEMDNYNTMLKHIKQHMKNGILTKCPFHSCDKTYKNVNSFTGHVSKIHKQTLNSRSIVSTTLVGERNINDLSFNEEIITQENELLSTTDICDEIYKDKEETNYDRENLNLHNLAMFYMKLEYNYLVPESTIQYIVSELRNVQKQEIDAMKKGFSKKLVEVGIAVENLQNILQDIFTNKFFVNSHDALKSCHLRKKYYKTHLNFVAPEKKLLCKPFERNEEKFFYYIPLKNTIKAIFCDKSLDLVLDKAPCHKEGIYSDFTDGYVFLNNKFFQDNPSALRLILYQDSFEVVTPIGPARKKHKILAVYLSIGNLPNHIRLNINSIQLVALCLEKEFKHEEVYAPIVADLKDLEENGIIIPEHGTVKGSLVFIMGDNLGSHTLGGFVENFSRSSYFCRYCLIQRKSFYSKDGENAEHQKRTKEIHTVALQKLKDNLSNTSYEGVKFNSIFNELSNFHVCMPGLPPCIGHDLFEGIVAFDLALYIKYFVEKKWFSYTQLNYAIQNFHYSSNDIRDKPIPFHGSNRIIGGACQVWTFLRLFPLIIKTYIKDIADEVWMSLLKLTEIVEIVCAPVIINVYLPYLQELIYEYLNMRRENFPSENLRPKHHYLTHAAANIAAFGPLMKGGNTLRFESKHTFFKRKIRSSRNYINILHTLSTAHELRQSYNRTGADLRCNVEINGATDLFLTNYSQALRDAIIKRNVQSIVQECISVVVKGTTYTKGDIVILRQDSYQCNVQMGRITLILFSNIEEIFFVVNTLRVTFISTLRLYEIHDSTQYECVSTSELLSYYPLNVYKININEFVKLKYGLISS